MSTGSSKIRILTVDDHPIVRQGIAGLIGIQPDMTFGRRGIQWPRSNPAIPDAPSGRHADGLADAGDEWPRRAHRNSK